MRDKAQATPNDIARWMLALLKREGILSQHIAAHEIGRRFGEKFTPLNMSGNLSIRRDVLSAFKKISEKTVVWERGERRWRRRERGDLIGRQQI
jgi:hypothetical protein